MGYIDEIFERLDIQHIPEFLLHGVEETTINPKSYKERLDIGRKSAMGMLQAKFPDDEEFEQITDHLYDYVTATEQVYMEIGLQSGFILAMQMMTNTKTQPEKRKR